MRDRFASSQIALHWITFLLLVTAYCTMELRGFAQRGWWQGYALIITHFSAGSAVLAMMLLRLCLRFRHRSPEIAPSLPRWQSLLSRLTHASLYALFIALPVLGILSRYFRGRDW